MNDVFDTIAAHYDADFTNSSIGKMQRQLVWNYLNKLNLKHQHILEINCGTGEDAVFLAEKENTVLATDASGLMLEVTKQKINAKEINTSCTTMQWNLNQPFPAIKEEKYDLIFSNFGGLNCISPTALKALAIECHQLLKPKGKMIVVVMGNFCLWEMLYFLSKAKWNNAVRRLQKKLVIAKLNTTTAIETYYYNPNQIKKIVEPYFSAKKSLPIGFFIPPSYLQSFFVTHKRKLLLLNKCELKISNWQFLANFSDHYLITLHKVDINLK